MHTLLQDAFCWRDVGMGHYCINLSCTLLDKPSYSTWFDPLLYLELHGLSNVLGKFL